MCRSHCAVHTQTYAESLYSVDSLDDVDDADDEKKAREREESAIEW